MDKFNKKYGSVIKDLMVVFDKHDTELIDGMLICQCITQTILEDIIKLDRSRNAIDRLCLTMIRSTNMVYSEAKLPITTILGT